MYVRQTWNHKLPEESISNKLLDIRLGNDFSDSKRKCNKCKNKHPRLHQKLKSSCTAKEIWKKKKKSAPTEWKKISANHTFDKGLISKIYSCPQLTVVQPTIFHLYANVKAIFIQQKRYFKFWILVFTLASHLWYDILWWCWAEEISYSSQLTITSKGYQLIQL